jgi:hypothetical protein
VQEPEEVILRTEAARLVDRTARGIIDLAGLAAFDAVEAAYLSRDRPKLSPAEDEHWTRAMALSSSLLVPVLAGAESDDRHEVDTEVGDGVRGLIDEGVAEMRALVQHRLAEALGIFHGLAGGAEDDSSQGELLDSVIGIFASHELELS